MKMTEHALHLLRDLSDAPGASGFEDEVVAVARRWCAPIGPMKEDFLRNLYIHRKENHGGRPVVMLDAHSDEVGLVVHSIKPNGTLRFLMLGSWNKNALIGTRVRVRNADGDYIPGIIAAKPVHFMSAAEKANPTVEISDMVIDIDSLYSVSIDSVLTVSTTSGVALHEYSKIALPTKGSATAKYRLSEFIIIT